MPSPKGEGKVTTPINHLPLPLPPHIHLLFYIVPHFCLNMADAP